MLELIQNKVSESILSSSYEKMEEIEMTMNRDLIQKDLDRLRLYSEEPKNKYDKLNISKLTKYLEKLLKYVDEQGNYEMCWYMKNGLPNSYPLTLISEKAYGLNTCNYIETDENIVEIDLTNIADMIAFEIMFRDLGESHKSIEKLLKNYGIIGYHESSVITDYLRGNGDHPFQLSKSMKIGDTPYKSKETNKVHDYFYSKEFKTDVYKDVVNYSCKYAAAVITANIIKNSLHLGTDVKIVMVNASNITLIKKSDVDIHKLVDEISVRIFGRHFVDKPNILVF